MAGLLVGAGPAIEVSRFTAGLAMMRILPDERTDVLHVENDCVVGVSLRPGERSDVAIDRLRGTAVVVAGRPVDPDRGRVIDASELLAAVAEQGARVFESLDGGFVALTIDRDRRRIVVVNDRMATLPMHVVATAGATAIATHGRAALHLTGQPARIDPGGAMEFLAFGHAVGDRTLLENVRLLGPASRIAIGLDDGHADVHRYWDLTFRPRTRVRESVAADELHERLASSVRAEIDPLPERSELLLTGGYDSRTLLAYLVREGCPPNLARTWGARDDVPRSDVGLARTIAERFDVPFEFHSYEASTFAEEARDWALVSELASDNLGNFAAGPGFLRPEGEAPALAFIGDHMFGAGGIPLSPEDAIEAAAGLPSDGTLPSGLRALVRTGARRDVLDEIRSGVDGIVVSRSGATPKEVQDHLGFHLRIGRWLNAPTYFREPVLSVARPMLHAGPVELFQELPEGLRVDRRLHLTLLRRHFPHLLRTPVSSASSLIDWRRAFWSNGPVARYLAELLSEERLDASPLATVLDRSQVKVLHENAIGTGDGRTNGSASRWLPALRRAVSSSRLGSLAIRRAQRTVSRALRRSVGVSTRRALIRLALVHLFADALRDGSDVSGHATDPHPTVGPSKRAAPSFWDERGVS